MRPPITRRPHPLAWPWEPTNEWRAANPNGPILAIVGSRKFLNPNAYSLALGIIHRALTVVQPRKVISGGADGMDRFGETLALLSGFEFEAFLPRCPRWEPDGYKERNIMIATACTHLLCIRCQGSATAGSAFTADAAESMGRAIQRVTLPVGGFFASGVERTDTAIRG